MVWTRALHLAVLSEDQSALPSMRFGVGTASVGGALVLTEGATVLDERQQRVHDALQGRSEKLAGIYRATLGALGMTAQDAHAGARISIVCHCMRELMTGLPAVMAEETIPRPKPSSGSLVQRLPALLGSHPELDLAVDQDLVPVPRAVARAVLALVTAQVQEVGRNRSNAASLITAGTDDNHPAIDQWMEAYNFFVAWAHLDQNYEGRTLPTDEQLAENVRVVEDVITVRSAMFFENLHSVEDLLAEINATSDGDE